MTARKDHGILNWLWKQRREARRRGGVLVRVEMSPEHWHTLCRVVEPYAGAIDYYDPDGPRVFGMKVRKVPGLREPTVVWAE